MSVRLHSPIDKDNPKAEARYVEIKRMLQRAGTDI
jgi:hypothetical protein